MNRWEKAENENKTDVQRYKEQVEKFNQRAEKIETEVKSCNFEKIRID